MTQQNARTALITGASSGIGAAFARQLAVRGYNLILVARRQERLTALADNFQHQYTITAEYIAADLSSFDGVGQIENLIGQRPALDMLINNAGFGTSGKFAEVDLAKQLDMV